MARARRILAVLIDSATGQGHSFGQVVRALAQGDAATQIGQIELSKTPPPEGLACASGCAFCCILTGKDGGTITEVEATTLHSALAPLAGQTDGRAWHPQACPSLDPETRMCRVYDARPMICRSYVSTNVVACEHVAAGQSDVKGPGVLGAQATYLTSHALARKALVGVAQVPTYSMARIAQGAVEGEALADTLAAALHPASELQAERKRVAGGA